MSYACGIGHFQDKLNFSASTQNFPATANYTFPAVFHNLLSTTDNHFSPPWSVFYITPHECCLYCQKLFND